MAEHARLKDHVASMNGGLEARIHEGGKLYTVSYEFNIHRHCLVASAFVSRILIQFLGEWENGLL